MCGICGSYSFNQTPVKVEDIKAMCNVIIHRGPDDEGIFLDKIFGMGMRRLSIIDLDTGHQPISNENDTIIAVLNGEIYNYRELTKDLEEKGHIFKSKSDTEVLVHLFEEYSYDFVRYLRGMFGLAIWNRKNQELIIARDPLGIKQLYFLRNEKKFIFGSEIKCILQVLGDQPKVNKASFNHYLSFLYFPDDLTIFENIVKLKPGHLLKVSNFGVKDAEFWNLNKLQQINFGFSEAQDKFLRLMEESMSLHLRSDVPLGVFLSGGIDSSIITAIGAGLTEKPLNTFTVGYGNEGNFYDERKFARIIAKQFKTNHKELVISPDIEKTIYKLVSSFDEPFANSSAIPNYYICQMMRKEVKVALSGLGGDEIAGGYERYSGMNMLSRFKKSPAFLKKYARILIDYFPDSKSGNYFSDRCKRFARALNVPSEKAYYNIISLLDRDKKSKILPESFNSKKDESYDLYSKIIGSSNQLDPLRSAMFFDIVSYMTNDLLVLTDRTSMANSLEVRVPFLDHKLVEFMFQVPSEFKIRGLQKKYILKQVFKDKLPKEILYRKKRGFSTPLSVWLRKDLLDLCNKIFEKRRIEATEVLNYPGVQLLLNDHINRKANNQVTIFALMTFVIWHEMYIQKKNNMSAYD